MRKKIGNIKIFDGCKFYNPECRLGACSIYPYQKKKVVVSGKEAHDTS